MATTLIAPAKPKQKYPDFGVWLTYAEAIHSNTAIDYHLDNTPNAAQYARMVYTYEQIYAPLCEWVGEKIPVNSFFRSEAVNNVVPGASSTSQHVKGGAIDLDCQRFKNPLTNNQLFEHVRTTMGFDQLIFENPDRNNVPGWVHISADPLRQRKMILKMVRTKSGPDYIQWPFRV